MISEPAKRAIALVSGGLDSVVSLAMAIDELEVRLVLFFDYGQRALRREREASVAAANYYGLPFREVDIRWLSELAPAGMRESNSEVEPLDTLDAVWVPNRNGVFLNVAAAYAESYGCGVVTTGFNREEAGEFPDNSTEYVRRANSALELSTRNAVTVRSFTIDLDKRQIIREGMRLRAPLSTVWSCYHAREQMCGTCASCQRFRAAIASLPADECPRVQFETGE